MLRFALTLVVTYAVSGTTFRYIPGLGCDRYPSLLLNSAVTVCDMCPVWFVFRGWCVVGGLGGEAWCTQLGLSVWYLRGAREAGRILPEPGHSNSRP